MESKMSSHLCRLLFGTLALLSALPALAAGPEMASGILTNALPLKEVTLYSSGLGFFQRAGEVEGKATVELSFKTDDVNDLLKSMVVQDFDGGQVSTVTYSSRDPLAKTLKSFAIDLASNPGLGGLLGQLRGDEVEVLRPTPLRGTVMGVETKTEPVGDSATVDREYLVMLTEDGLQSVPLHQVQSIKLLNPRLNTELRQALQALAAGHDTQKKPVTILFEGTGKRRVAVAYVAQTPVWKTSYRLVLDDGGKPYFQGWAIVENTSDADWENIRLSLVSGRPISFAMDLYQPLYTTRPVVEPELYLSLRPPVHGDAMARGEAVLGLEGNGIVEERVATAAAKGVPVLGDRPALGRLFRQQEISTGYRVNALAGLGEATIRAAQGGAAGELFQYVIESPVSLARQKSAMLPIISAHLEAEKVSIFNAQVQSKHPLNGLRLKNSSSMHLMQGPITVFDGGAYAGDGRMEDLAAGQDRLISYALDIKTEVEAQVTQQPAELLTVALRKGTLLITRRTAEEMTYVIRNRDQKKKTVLVEHPFRANWELVAPKEPRERTRDVYRFAIEASPGATQKLLVQEQTRGTETLQLANEGLDLIAFYIKAKQVSPQVKEALEKVVSMRERLDRTAAERTRREQRVSEISQEQVRLRENMNRLSQASDLYRRYVTKLDQQETELESLRKQIEAAKDRESEQRRELDDFLMNLEAA
jgi:hypothetical protein